MSPEQMSGGGCDRRADVWSLGVILREGLTGRPLFRRDTDAETIYAVTHETLPPWDTNVPVALQRIAEKALQRDVNLRYATAREMGQDLMRFVTSQVVPMGMPEVSVWMHRMFAEDIEKKRRVLQRAHVRAQANTAPLSLPPITGQHAAAPPPRPGTSDEDATRMERSGAIQLGSNDTNPSISKVRSLDSDVHATELLQPRERTAQWIRSLTPWQWAGPLGGLALLGALLLVISGDPGPAPAQNAAPPPPVAAPVAEEAARADTSDTPATAATPDPDPEPEPSVEPAPAAKPTLQRSESPARATAKPARAAAKPRAKRAAAKPPGTVNIVTSNGWAEVYLRGKKLGTTPGRFTLPAGIQVIGLKRLGQGAIQRQTVLVKSGGTAKLRVALK